MSASVVWDGLDELRAALRKMPEELASEASTIVNAKANEAARRIVDLYPTRTGNLKDGVSVSRQASGRFGVGVLVRNRAPHAAIFEHGSQARHTSIGANRGSMPPGNVFIPTVIRYRRDMYSELKDLLVRHGLEVSGEP